ncbi:g-type lectin s-receptor-like serine/threonine-protein kinase rlk1 [Quercus suber]|uniref:G-type lectin s-receptor-like serine/threonine-protein kinase rlk1 n=1 Tax=Quercus suber TaxID=58331 RepID=A0AAW0LTE2_QUESU
MTEQLTRKAILQWLLQLGLAHFCLLLLLLLLLPLLPTVFTYTKDDCNILLKSPAIVTDQGINPLFMSRSGEFAFGFRATQGSELKLSSKNEFVLNDPQGKELWKAPRNGSKSSCAAILDNGNLLTLDEQYNSIWESIKEPTNTILPGQILYMKTTLRSRESEANYSDGRFKLSLQRVAIWHFLICCLKTMREFILPQHCNGD